MESIEQIKTEDGSTQVVQSLLHGSKAHNNNNVANVTTTGRSQGSRSEISRNKDDQGQPVYGTTNGTQTQFRAEEVEQINLGDQLKELLLSRQG